MVTQRMDAVDDVITQGTRLLLSLIEFRHSIIDDIPYGFSKVHRSPDTVARFGCPERLTG